MNNILSLKEPSSDECYKNTQVYETENQVGYAIWYPQMGGYSSHAVVVMYKHGTDGPVEDNCFDAYIWHDGNFPFSDSPDKDKMPASLHHCSPNQFIKFGNTVLKLEKSVPPV